jgi:tetratricopeptide (TPR) repeat protein
MAAAASWFWGLEGLFAEAQRWLDQARAVDDLEPEVRAAILMGQADHAASLGELDLAVATARSAAALYEQVGEPRGLARSLLYFGVALWGLGRLDEAAAAQDRMAATFRSIGDEWGFGLALLLRCRTAVDLDEDGIEENLDTALAIARRGGDPHVIGLCLEQRSRVALRAGDVDLAIELGRQSLDHNQQVGYVEGIVASMHALGAAMAVAGRPDEARALHEEGMALAVDLDHPGAMAEGLECLAVLDVSSDPARALIHLAAADALRERRSVPRPRSFERSVEPARSAMTAQLSDDEIERALRTGRLVDVRQVVAPAPTPDLSRR